jgi:hypothetical protein
MLHVRPAVVVNCTRSSLLIGMMVCLLLSSLLVFLLISGLLLRVYQT